MPTLLGFSGPFTHRDASDINYWQRWQPPTIKLFNEDWNSTEFLSAMFTTLPNTLFTFRNWPQSEEHEDVMRDPIGTGVRHANEWAERVWTGRDGSSAWSTLPGFKRENLIFHGINEPQVWLMREQTVQYNVAFLDRLRHHNLRGAALNLGVGWPDNTGPDTKVNWQPYEPVRQAIQRGNHILFLHEYWDLGGVRENYGWWVHRLRQCSWDVPIIIGEAGIDRGVKYPAHSWPGTRGWSGHRNAEQYVRELEEYDVLCQGDRRIIGIQIFTYDFNNPVWASFAVQGIRAYLTEYAERVRSRPRPAALPFPWCPPNVVNCGETPVPNPTDPYLARLLAAAESRIAIRFNPQAAIQRAMVLDGFVPNSPEFGFEGKIAQRGERLDNGRVRVYTWSSTEGVKKYDRV